MLYVSISRTDAAPTPIATAVSRIFLARRTRSDSHTRLESSTPAMARFSCGMMTAHATTGPARGPRPTSSTPASSGPCVARSWRSIPLHRFLPSAMPEGKTASSDSALAFRCGRFRNTDAYFLLPNTCRLAGEGAEIEQLRAAHATATQHRDVGDHRAVQGEDALDAHAVRNLANRKRRAHTATTTRDADTFEGLEAFLVTFANTDIDAQRIAGAERRDRLHPLLLGFYERVHGLEPGWSHFGETD